MDAARAAVTLAANSKEMVERCMMPPWETVSRFSKECRTLCIRFVLWTLPHVDIAGIQIMSTVHASCRQFLNRTTEISRALVATASEFERITIGRSAPERSRQGS